ncbi:MAG TPA: ABC transporter ATP-binding protein [Acidimicrobiia bacterium]|jgi:branched-chain amino acid transport system ATP-binding protein|nr:ABC transporter ATP-binding protein [Acidimicrobiia bacterium]
MSDSTSALLEARDITVRFGGLVALDGVGLSVRPGEIVGLIGPNGAGKSTCFGVLSGLLRPAGGSVWMQGVDVTRASPQARAHRGIARTFQRLELFGELTVREHLVVAYRARQRRTLASLARALPLDLIGLGNRPTPRENEVVDAILEELRLDSVAGTSARAIGLGTGRLVEVARALAAQPSVLLLDEPSSGLDANETAELSATLRRVREQEDVALVLVEHNVDMVLGLADSVTVLDFGRVIATGSSPEIRADAAVQAAYLGARS